MSQGHGCCDGRRNRGRCRISIQYLTAATTRDPSFARAYATLAESYTVPAAFSDRPPRESRDIGVQAAEEALRLDSGLADAHYAMGWLAMIGLRWEDAGSSFRRAVPLDRRAPRGRLYHSLYLHRLGRYDEALGQLEQARHLDPLSPAPDFPIAHAVLGHIHLGTGRLQEAIRHYKHVAEQVPSSFYAGFLGHAHARAGRTEDARRIVDDMVAKTGRGEYVSPGALGWVLLGLHDVEEGYRHLGIAVEQRDVILTIYGLLANRSLTAPYEDDPQFRQLRRAAGMVR